MADKPENTLYLLGKYLGLAFLLPSGAIAGYLIGLRIRRFLEDPSAEKPSTEPSSACRIDSSASGRVV